MAESHMKRHYHESLRSAITSPRKFGFTLSSDSILGSINLQANCCQEYAITL